MERGLKALTNHSTLPILLIGQTRKISCWLVMALLMLLVVMPSQSFAQEYAAVLRIVRAGVEIRRVNTEQWFTLPVSAELPIGAGDIVRTDGSGRAFVTFGEDAESLLLPETTLEIVAFDADSLNLRLTGQSLQSVAVDGGIRDFALDAGMFTVTQPAALFGVWTQAEAAVITVASGEAQVSVDAETFTVAEGNGLRATQSGDVETEALAAPLSAARLIGQLDGCAAITQTVGELNVNVRVGPGFSFTVIGSIANGEPVRVMGINTAGTWYRIQAFSGFGWMQVPLVENTCTDLPVLPNSTIEQNIGIFLVSQAELALLEPFYGTPEDDLWFYRSVLEEE